MKELHERLFPQDSRSRALRCSSTHCERREECASPSDCAGTGRGLLKRGIMSDERGDGGGRS